MPADSTPANNAFMPGGLETDFAEIALATPGDQSFRFRFEAAAQSIFNVTATYNSATCA
jgi:hypothetical protein